MLQILFGALPLAGAFERDAVVVKQRPALGHADRGGTADRLLIGGDGLGKALFVAQDIAELHLRRNRLRLLGGHRLQLSDRLIGALERVEIDRAAQPRRRVVERVRLDLRQNNEAFLRLVLGAQDIGQQ